MVCDMSRQNTSVLSNEALQKNSFLEAENATYLENLYEQYLKDPSSISANLSNYFAQLPEVKKGTLEKAHSEIQANLRELAAHRTHAVIHAIQELPQNLQDLEVALLAEKKQIQVRTLIDEYRWFGHLQADIDPLKMREKPEVPELMLSYYHLSENDLDTVFDAGTLPGPKKQTLREIVKTLKQIYCGHMAIEFMHIPDFPQRIWIQEQIEKIGVENNLSKETKLRILDRIGAAEGLEKYLNAKYPGAKRFSIEGTDSLIVALDTYIQQGGSIGAEELVISMAHRGRLNVLVNIFGKLPSKLFDEFEGQHDETLESGDVKYHQGFSSNVSTPGGNVHLALAFNPSHLEIVTPVTCGSVRARQERRKDIDKQKVLSVSLHGDAAFSGQGVVMETLNMSHTRGFGIGGMLHIVVNNQIGFTTSLPRDSRSTLYCSDIGKMLEIPIIHVNADDPEAVYQVTSFALAYRTMFKKDIILDLVGYRRYGHNEADEPMVTQPVMYQMIRKLPTVYTQYTEKLIKEQVISKEEADNIEKEYRNALDKRQNAVAKNLVNHDKQEYSVDWSKYFTQDWRIPAKTGVSSGTLKAIAEKMLQLPEGFALHPRVKKIMEERQEMTLGKRPLDWGYGEIMSYATLLQQGYFVRLCGQDSGRGTFFHRHAVLHNQVDGEEYTPLAHISEKQGHVDVVDSLLSETAVVAFEYGFASTEPRGLVVWEAQFGDFANNAQVVVDQFISSGEQKWGRLCGLVMLLPHGYEGQGPEHSSARLERYLQLCAQHNMQVCTPTTPAQIFHLLRRQVIRPMRKPLIVMTPKSFLRHKAAVSTLEDLENGSFLPVIPERDHLDIDKIQRVVLCGGKVFYDLLDARRAKNIENVAIIRIEQLYPFPDIELQAELKKYDKVTDIIWCQEEPQNQGAWYCSQHHFQAALNPSQTLRYVGREASAAASVGYLHLHNQQQLALVNEALDIVQGKK